MYLRKASHEMLMMQAYKKIKEFILRSSENEFRRSRKELFKYCNTTLKVENHFNVSMRRNQSQII